MAWMSHGRSSGRVRPALTCDDTENIVIVCKRICDSLEYENAHSLRVD